MESGCAARALVVHCGCGAASSTRLMARRPMAAITFGDIEIDAAQRRLLRAGQPIRLSRIEWGLLELLARNYGQVLTHRMLLRAVWGDAYGEELNYLHVYIRRLRRKLEPDPASPRYLVSE